MLGPVSHAWSDGATTPFHVAWPVADTTPVAEAPSRADSRTPIAPFARVPADVPP